MNSERLNVTYGIAMILARALLVLSTTTLFIFFWLSYLFSLTQFVIVVGAKMDLPLLG